MWNRTISTGFLYELEQLNMVEFFSLKYPFCLLRPANHGRVSASWVCLAQPRLGMEADLKTFRRGIIQAQGEACCGPIDWKNIVTGNYWKLLISYSTRWK
jgi:hypothetical protein